MVSFLQNPHKRHPPHSSPAKSDSLSATAFAVPYAGIIVDILDRVITALDCIYNDCSLDNVAYDDGLQTVEVRSPMVKIVKQSRLKN